MTVSKPVFERIKVDFNLTSRSNLIVKFYPCLVLSLYRAAESVLNRNWRTVKKKKGGLELPFEGDFYVDIIPGKFSSKDNNYAYLYNNKTGGRFQTSIYIQVNHTSRYYSINEIMEE